MDFNNANAISTKEYTGITPLTLHKTLKENLPKLIDVVNDEIHFTETGEIFISDNKGNMKQCITSETIINDVNNALTMQPLEYGCFKYTDIKGVNENIYPSATDFNMALNINKEPMLRKGILYKVTSIISNCKFNSASGKLVMNLECGGEVKQSISLTNVQADNSIGTGNCVSYIILLEDTVMETKLISTTGHTSYELNVMVEEVRNNPVNQYGGFETQILFEGKASESDKYVLADSVDNYDFILGEISYPIKAGETIVPKMTSNTTPAPYVVTSNPCVNQPFGAFNGINGIGDNVWYSNDIPAWIKIDLAMKSRIHSFSIKNASSSANFHAYPPKSFTFEYSDDDVNFTIAKRVENMKMLSPFEKMEFILDEAIDARYIKLNITEGYNAGIIIDEIGLYGGGIEEKSFVHLLKNCITRSGNDSFVIEKNRLTIGNMEGKVLRKVVGIKGSLPSLLSGGTF